MALIPAQIVDRSYALHEPLGKGGMGTVFRATQLVSGLDVALKLVAPNPTDTELTAGSLVDHRLALTREFQTVASLQHENVIRVLSYGFDPVCGPYYTMELLENPQNIIAAGHGKSDAEKVQLIAQLLRALVYLHARGVLHRDIKPGDGAGVVPFAKRALRTRCGHIGGALPKPPHSVLSERRARRNSTNASTFGDRWRADG